jgi:hypothetical protein
MLEVFGPSFGGIVVLAIAGIGMVEVVIQADLYRRISVSLKSFEASVSPRKKMVVEPRI